MRFLCLSCLLLGCGVATLESGEEPAPSGQLPEVDWRPEDDLQAPVPAPEPEAPPEAPAPEPEAGPEPPPPDLPEDEEPDAEPEVPEAPFADDPCEGLDYLGECVGGDARWCDEDGALRTEDCGADGCGWVNDQIGWYCGGAPGEDPEAPPPDVPDSPAPEDPCGSPEEAEVVRLVNASRQQRGLGALECEPAGAAAARAHSEDMCDAGYFSHTGRDGSSAGDRMRRAGAQFGGWGENIAYGQRDAAEVHRTWMNSPGHHANIMGRYRRIGVGLAPCGGRNYWTEVFLD